MKRDVVKVCLGMQCLLKLLTDRGEKAYAKIQLGMFFRCHS
jgi:hypothetical protein